MKKLLFLVSAFLLTVNIAISQNAWINEIHYDNNSTDIDEGVEVVIQDVGNYTLNLFVLNFYNGSNGEAGSNIILNADNSSTEGNYTIYFIPMVLQNGSPDGIALSYNATLIQFLSYEGSFIATDGVANGITSSDIGVSESTIATVSHSLQLSGTGSTYTDFSWQNSATATSGTINNSQILSTPPARYLSGYLNSWGADLMVKRALGTVSWILSKQYTTGSGDPGFKFRESSDNWDFNWGRGDNVVIEGLTDWYAGGSNSLLSYTQNKYYTYILENVSGGTNTKGYVFETDAMPVTITDVKQNYDYATSNDEVEITITTSAARSPQENIFVRYTTDNWNTSSLVEINYTTYKANIPAQAEGTAVNYYVFTTTIDNPTGNIDLLTINFANNGGFNYEYTVTAPNPAVFFSEYIKGTSFNKALEIHNATGGDINLADYEIWKITNGGSWTESTTTLSGTLATASVYTIANASAIAEIINKTDFQSSAMTFTGNDAIGLAYLGRLIDVVGTDGVDPGTGWNVAGTVNATADHTLVRKSSVITGNRDWTSSAGTNTDNSEWEVKNIDDFSYFNWHIETIWDGMNWSNNIPSSSNSALIAENYIEATDFECYNLLVNSGFTLEISAEQTVTVNGDLTNNGTILLKSDGATTAASGALITKGAITNNGTMTAQKFLTTPNAIPTDETGTGNWHLVGSPLNGNLAVETIFASDNSSFVYEYLQADPWWNNLALGNNIETKKGYLAQTVTEGGENITFSGTFQTGNLEFELSTAGDKWNLIANPYPSAIDLEELSISGAVTDFYTFDVWAGNYLTYSTNTHSGTASQYIKSMQGFFVGASGAVKTPVASTITFTDAARVPNTVEFNVRRPRKGKDKTNNLLYFTVNNQGHKYDAAIINFAKEESQSLKMFSLDAEAPQTYIFEDNENSTIKTYVEIDELRVVPIAFECKLAGNYTFNTKEFSITKRVMLHDIFTNTWLTIDNNTSYEFTHTAGAEKHRFDIYFNSTPTAIETTENNLAQIYSHASTIYINLAYAEKSTIAVFDLSGRKVKEINSSAKAIQINSLQEGTYIVKVASDRGNKVEKVFVK